MRKRLLDELTEQMNIKLPGQLYHMTQIDMAYNSNRIEGSTLSHDDTRYIYETRSLVGKDNVKIDDVIETSNHFILFNNMLKSAEKPLTSTMIKEYHNILKTGTADAQLEWFAARDYKKRTNSIGGRVETTPPEKVSDAIERLLKDYNGKTNITIDELVWFHYNFEKIHPFQDGNGRVGRMILFKECLKNDIMPFVILDEEKGFYYKGLDEYPIGTRLRDTFLHFQDIYAAKVKYYLPDFAMPDFEKTEEGRKNIAAAPAKEAAGKERE